MLKITWHHLCNDAILWKNCTIAVDLEQYFLFVLIKIRIK